MKTRGSSRTAGLVSLWYSSNIGVLLLNKYLLIKYGFTYPIFLTMCHMTTRLLRLTSAQSKYQASFFTSDSSPPSHLCISFTRWMKTANYILLIKDCINLLGVPLRRYGECVLELYSIGEYVGWQEAAVQVKYMRGSKSFGIGSSSFKMWCGKASFDNFMPKL